MTVSFMYVISHVQESRKQASMTEEFLTEKVVLKQTSSYPVALTFYRGHLYLAWVGSDHFLNLMRSSDGGRSFDLSSKFTSQEQSRAKPALAVYQDKLYIAWTGMGGLIYLMHSTDGGNTFDPSTKSASDEMTFSPLGIAATLLLEHSHLRIDGPSLAVYQNRLYVAWADPAHHPCMMCSTDGGKTFNPATKFASQEVCYHLNMQSGDSPHPGPVLAVYENRLHMAWIGSNLRPHFISSTDGGVSLDSSTKWTVKEVSQEPLVFTSYKERPLLAWRGVGLWNYINVLSFPTQQFNASSPVQKRTSKEKTSRALALAANGDQLVAAWTAGLMGHLCIAQCHLPLG